MTKKARKIFIPLMVISLISAWEKGKKFLFKEDTNLISEFSKADTFFLAVEIERFIQNDINFIIVVATVMILPLFTLVRRLRNKNSEQALNLKEKVKLLRGEAINCNKEIIPIKVNSRRKHFTRGEEELMSKINLMRNYGK
jgi:hypothetical protein